MTEFNIGERVRYNSAVDGRGVRCLHGRLGVVTDSLSPYTVKVQWDHEEDERVHGVEFLDRVQDAPAAGKAVLPHDSAERKGIPLYSVLFGYFPSAMVALAKHAHDSNEKHNPGEELHWSRAKSDDHADAALRHLVEGDYVGLLWRAAALLQLELEEQGHSVAPLAR